MNENKMSCSTNSNKIIEIEDDTFTKPGERVYGQKLMLLPTLMT
jgi:hypothetical protein